MINHRRLIEGVPTSFGFLSIVRHGRNRAVSHCAGLVLIRR